MIATVHLFGRRLQITPELRDHALVTLWILVTFKQFRYDELILYPLALYFLYAFIRDFDRIFDILRRSLFLWFYPTWFMLTLAWGTETGLILKTNLQLVLTLVICYCAILRLSSRQIMVSVLIAAGWFGFLSLVTDPGGGIAARGVFSSKNTLGAAMVMLFTAALCILVDRGAPRLARMVSFVALPVSVHLILLSDSMTAVMLALSSLAIVTILTCRSLLNGPALLSTGFLLVAILLLGAMFFAVAIPEADPVGYVLGAFGKDGTLTGRTVLWDYAREEIARHPWLGVGYGGFWTPEDPLSAARRIYDEFYKAYYAIFSFHSTYFEIAVHQGLIGAGLVILTAAWAVLQILPGALLGRSVGAIYFACVALLNLAHSLTEVVLMVPFKLDFMLFMMGALLAVKARAEISAARFYHAEVPVG